MADVFVSYVAEDSAVACQIGDGLKKAGFSTWMYERDVLPGVSYLIQTGDAIKACHAFVLLVTASSLGSNQVGVEIVRAFEENKPLFPLRQGISHADMQRRQPIWRQAIGSSASIAIDPTDMDATVRRVVAGLRVLGVEPGRTDEEDRIQTPVNVVAPVKYEVFLSGHSRHQEFLGRLAAYLQTSGITTFTASLLGGGEVDLARHIDQALDSARCLVVVLGKNPDDLSSSWTRYEWMSFHNEVLTRRKQDGMIIPVLLDLPPENLPLPLRLFQFLQCDLAEPDKTFAALKMIIAKGRGNG